MLRHTCKHELHLPMVKTYFSLDSNNYGFICYGVNNVDGYKRNDCQYNLSSLLQTYCCFEHHQKIVS